MSSRPITLVSEGGVPFVEVALGGQPATISDDSGEPFTAVERGAAPRILLNGLDYWILSDGDWDDSLTWRDGQEWRDS